MSENFQTTLRRLILINKLFETDFYLRPLFNPLAKIFEALKTVTRLQKTSKFNRE